MKKTMIDLEEIEKIDNCLFVLVRIGMSRRVRNRESVGEWTRYCLLYFSRVSDLGIVTL